MAVKEEGKGGTGLCGVRKWLEPWEDQQGCCLGEVRVGVATLRLREQVYGHQLSRTWTLYCACEVFVSKMELKRGGGIAELGCIV